jgi:hypothetical protein
MMKKSLVLSFVIFSLLSAQEFSNVYLTHRFDYSDSIRLPPRMRGFGDAEYFDNFIKPRSRDSLNVRCVGRWPFGPGFEVYGDTVNDILCFGSGSGILVFDISNPSNPISLSQIAVSGLIMQIYMRDSLLFVSSYGNGIEVFDLSDPSNAVKISQINVPTRDFCLKDTFTYCVAEDSLRIVNIADLSNPFQVGACWDSSYTISMSGNYVYTGGRWKLSAINVSNPSNPQVVNYLPIWVYTLTADGNHCYCVIHDTPGFRIYNISNPLNIWQESQLDEGGVDIYKLGSFVYLPGFVIVDVTDSANPYVVGDTSLPVYAQAVWVNNTFGYGYVANDYEGLTVININNPVNPVASASIYGAHDTRDVFVVADYAYVTNWAKGLKILDVSDPSYPFEVGEYDTTGTPPQLEALWVRDSIAYLSVCLSYRVKTIDVSIPASPFLIGAGKVVEGAADMMLRDSLLYYVGGRIFQVVNIADPTSPESLPRYYLPNYTSAWAIFLQDSFAYIADGDSGLRIIDVSNPTAPYEVGYLNDPSLDYATGIFVKDTIAYLASGATGLRILNITNPSSPFEISFHPNAAIDVIVTDTIAYVTSYLGYVNILNIADPRNPSLFGYYVNPDFSYRLFLDSNLVYVTCHECGLSILECKETGIVEQQSSYFASKRYQLNISPNPIRKSVVLSISVPNETEYQLDLFDIQGRRIICLDRSKGAGLESEEYYLHGIPNGVYFLILRHEDGKLVRKIVVVH